jgi:DNA-binding transcriptional LysR family regulator
MNIRDVDLNLLVTFDALHEQGRVTAAARKLGLTQPAVSNALSRLRLLFEDPLFIRVGNTMRPTPRARELSRPIAAILSQVTQILGGPEEFVASKSELTVRVATTDHIEAVLLSRFMRHLRTSAPKVRLSSRRVAGIFEVPREELESGLVDLAIGAIAQPLSPVSGISARTLYQDRVVCIVRAAHPLIRRTITLKQFVMLEHVMVSYPGQGAGVLDRALAEYGMKRDVVVSLPHFSSAAFAVANSDRIAAVPASLARLLAVPLNLVILNLPFAVPALEIGVFWHSRNSTDPSSAWLRDQLACTVHEMGLAGPAGKSKRRHRLASVGE